MKRLFQLLVPVTIIASLAAASSARAQDVYYSGYCDEYPSTVCGGSGAEYYLWNSGPSYNGRYTDPSGACIPYGNVSAFNQQDENDYKYGSTGLPETGAYDDATSAIPGGYITSYGMQVSNGSGTMCGAYQGDFWQTIDDCPKGWCGTVRWVFPAGGIDPFALSDTLNFGMSYGGGSSTWSGGTYTPYELLCVLLTSETQGQNLELCVEPWTAGDLWGDPTAKTVGPQVEVEGQGTTPEMTYASEPYADANAPTIRFVFPSDPSSGTQYVGGGFRGVAGGAPPSGDEDLSITDQQMAEIVALANEWILTNDNGSCGNFAYQIPAGSGANPTSVTQCFHVYTPEWSTYQLTALENDVEGEGTFSFGFSSTGLYAEGG